MQLDIPDAVFAAQRNKFADLAAAMLTVAAEQRRGAAMSGCSIAAEVPALEHVAFGLLEAVRAAHVDEPF